MIFNDRTASLGNIEGRACGTLPIHTKLHARSTAGHDYYASSLGPSGATLHIVGCMASSLTEKNKLNFERPKAGIKCNQCIRVETADPTNVELVCQAAE